MFELVSRAVYYVWLRLVLLFLGLNLPRPKPNPDDTLEIPSREPGRSIVAHVYYPEPVTGTWAPLKPSAVLLNFFGGGFVFPLHGSDEPYCRQIATSTGHVVLDIRYRLAPAHPWPAAHDDAEDAIRWVIGQPTLFDAARISLSGFSSGANIATVAAGVTMPPGAIAKLASFYGPTDLARDRALKKAPDPSVKGPVLPPWMTRVLWSAYLGIRYGEEGARVSPRNPKVSPAFADPGAFPDSVLVITAAGDALCLEAEKWGAEMAESGKGKRVTVWRAEGCAHGWDKFYKPGTLQEKAKEHAYDLVVQLLNGQLE